MTNLEKMNELIGARASKKQIVQWAYMNRIPLVCLSSEEGFEAMEASVKSFMETDFFLQNMLDDEQEIWNKFLDETYIETKQ